MDPAAVYAQRARRPLLPNERRRTPDYDWEEEGDEKTGPPYRRSSEKRRLVGSTTEPGRWQIAYEAGKRHRHPNDYDNDTETTASSETDTDSSGSSDSGNEEARPPPKQSSSSKTYAVMAIIILVVAIVGAYAFVKLRSGSSSSSSSSSTTASGNDDSTAAAPQTVEGVSSSANAGTGTATTAGGGAIATATPAPGASSSIGAGSSSSGSAASEASSGAPADGSSSTSSPAASSSGSSGSGSAAGGAPDGITGITLSGTFADSASYTIATGTWADVPGESSTVALDGFTSTANAATATQGVIYVGDSTWYSAGNGGYGSCGAPLYDGQDIYFMGSPGPSTHCWECVALQSTKDPSKAITAIVADSCEACEFAHIDLEQKAYFALGGTVDSGTVTVAWEFIDCPNGYSESAIKALTSSVYSAVDTS
ncbi:hypothetical protein JCM5296_002301 [Sporobolomyces johnsonii]